MHHSQCPAQSQPVFPSQNPQKFPGSEGARCSSSTQPPPNFLRGKEIMEKNNVNKKASVREKGARNKRRRKASHGYMMAERGEKKSTKVPSLLFVLRDPDYNADAVKLQGETLKVQLNCCCKAENVQFLVSSKVQDGECQVVVRKRCPRSYDL